MSYRINVPRTTDLDLSTRNGSIAISGVSGNLRFDTTNGGVRLSDLGGRVNGRTTNGGLTVNLSGNQWDGEGIDVETSNGGVTLAIPEGYNAALEGPHQQRWDSRRLPDHSPGRDHRTPWNQRNARRGRPHRARAHAQRGRQDRTPIGDRGSPDYLLSRNPSIASRSRPYRRTPVRRREARRRAVRGSR